MTQLISRARTPGLYLACLALIGPAQITMSSVFGSQPTIYGHTLGVVVPLILAFVALLLWIADSSPWKVDRNLLIFSILLLLIWIFSIIREYVTGTGFNYSTFIVVVAAVLVAGKLPTFLSAKRALDTLILSLAMVAVLGSILDAIGYPLPDQFAPARLFFGIGFEYRWVGVFETTTQASAVGTYLLIYGLWRRTRLFYFTGFIGAAILLFGYSRGAIAATAVGLLTILWFHASDSRLMPNKKMMGVITFTVLTLGAAYIFFRDPTMSGRTPIWQAYGSQLFPQSPWIGLGSGGIDEFVRQSEELSRNGAMMHAHNFVLDVAARFGISGLLLIVCLFAFSLVVAIRAGKGGLWVAPALMIALVVNQLTDIHIDWRYLDHDYSVLFFTFVLSASYLRQQRLPAPESPSISGFKEG